MKTVFYLKLKPLLRKNIIPLSRAAFKIKKKEDFMDSIDQFKSLHGWTFIYSTFSFIFKK